MMYYGSPITKLLDFINASRTIDIRTIFVTAYILGSVSLILILYFSIKNYINKNRKLIMNFNEDSLNELINKSGYRYDKKNDIFYNHDNAWQKDFGYCSLYDEASAPSGMIIDCEPIYFEYDNKRWLIEFWKGQYGLNTGCEVGIYYTNEPDIAIPGVFNGPFFRCAIDVHNIKTAFTLLKDNTKLFSRSDNNWWVTGFMLGEFSYPSQLTMDIKITMDSIVMRNIFIHGLKEAGYKIDEIDIDKHSVSILFDKTHTPQPISRTKTIEAIMQLNNKHLCDKYNEITADHDTAFEKIQALREKSPKIFEQIISIGKPGQIFYNIETLNIEQ